jgi:hypothetical protein
LVAASKLLPRFRSDRPATIGDASKAGKEVSDAVVGMRPLGQSVAENILSIRVGNAAERRRLYIGAGWKSFDPAARPYTQAEIDAEHRSYNAGS